MSGASKSVTLDAGALIALEKNDERIRALFDRALSRNAVRAFVPAGVVAQVWRGGSKQARLAILLSDPATTVVPLDSERAQAAGVLCGFARTSDIVDASVVLCARENSTTIITSDPQDMARLDPSARIVAL
ncbi:MAG: PIN domain-containing protein [Acidothermaceae bacterium]